MSGIIGGLYFLSINKTFCTIGTAGDFSIQLNALK